MALLTFFRCGLHHPLDIVDDQTSSIGREALDWVGRAAPTAGYDIRSEMAWFMTLCFSLKDTHINFYLQCS
jgi:hypothetical protein